MCGCLVVSQSNHSFLPLTLHTRLGLSHPFVLGVSHCICNQPLDPIEIHLLLCMHGGERTTLNDVVQNAFMIIVKDTKFHVSWKTHILPPPTLQFLCRQIDIMLLVDGAHTLPNVIIVNPIWIDLVSQVIFSCGIVATVAAQMKDGFYYD